MPRQPGRATDSGATRRVWLLSGYTALAALLTVYGGSLVLRPPAQLSALFDDGLPNLVQIAAALLCLGRALRPGSNRPLALVLGSAMLVWSGGDVIWTLLSDGGAPPSPNVADLLFLAFYPLAYLALILLIRAGSTEFLPSSWLDGTMCALGAAAFAATFVFDSVLQNTGGRPLSVAVNLAYPTGDVVLLAIAAGALALLPQRLDVRWLLLIAGCLAFVASDTGYLLRSAAGTYHQGTFLDLGWPAGMLVMSLAVWLRPTRRAQTRVDGAILLVIPGIAAATGAGILGYGTRHHLTIVSVVLASATLLVSALRVLWAHRDLRTLSESRHQALTDDLTGLGNRRMFDQQVTRALAETAGRDALAVLLIDLDHFKEINDSFGHPVGDELLRLLAWRLRAALRRDDVLVRLGGDEFALLLLASDTDYSLEVAQRITGEVRRPFQLAQTSFEIRASIGIARYPCDATDAAGLLRCADVAMYRAKTAGNPYTVYDQSRDDSRHRFNLLTDLRRAIEERQLTVHYQPQLDLRSGEVNSVEALVRWPHPDKGLIPPDAFIPLAEETGLVRPLTRYVLDVAIAQSARWRTLGTPVSVAVNISPHDLLDHDFIGTVESLLHRHCVPPETLILEITERVLLADVTRAKHAIRQLQAMGITVSIDDFGTGFSALAYLRDLAVGELKLDRSFITGISAPDTDRDLEIVRAIIDLAHALQLRVVAEGIEDAMTLQLLGTLRCDVGQGYHIGRPQPPEQLALRAPRPGQPASAL